MPNSNIGYIICESEVVSSETKITSENLNGKVISENILQTADEKNRNGRYYSEEELFPQLTAPRTLELLNAGYLRAECGHPLSKDLQRQSTIDDTKTCARFLKLWTEGKNVKATVVGTNNELGRAFDADVKEGCYPAWSLRALGSIETTNRGAEVRNLRLITWDNVIYPSHPGAYMQKIVSEGAEVAPEKITHLQKLVKESVTPGNEDTILSTNSDKAIVIPIMNESVIKFIQSESSNLKFVRECFDFAYSNIAVNESGSKVILTSNDGDTIVVNLENYVHNQLMNYCVETQDLRDKLKEMKK